MNITNENTFLSELTLLDDRLLSESLKEGNNPMANGDQAIKPTPAEYLYA